MCTLAAEHTYRLGALSKMVEETASPSFQTTAKTLLVPSWWYRLLPLLHFFPPSYLRLGGVIITCTFGGTGISSVTLRGGYATRGNVLGYAHHNIWSILHTLNFYRESSFKHYFFVGENALKKQIKNERNGIHNIHSQNSGYKVCGRICFFKV